MLSGAAPTAVKLTSGTLPASLTVDPANGAITGPPEAGVSGRYPIQLTARYDADSTYRTIDEITVITPAE